MKHLKTFEKNYTHTKPNFKKGDYVICQDANDLPNNNIKLGEKYSIKKIKKTNDAYYCELNEVNGIFYCYRFITELEYHTNKYNL